MTKTNSITNRLLKYGVTWYEVLEWGYRVDLKYSDLSILTKAYVMWSTGYTYYTRICIPVLRD